MITFADCPKIPCVNVSEGRKSFRESDQTKCQFFAQWADTFMTVSETGPSSKDQPLDWEITVTVIFYCHIPRLSFLGDVTF